MTQTASKSYLDNQPASAAI